MATPCSCARKKRVFEFSIKKTRKNGVGYLSLSLFRVDGGKRNTELGKCCARL
jgi:hypothetical protein